MHTSELSAPVVRRNQVNLTSPYNYVPTEYVCAIFIALYALSTLIHIGQMFRYRLWWLLPTVVLAGVAEVLGWSARLWSSKNPLLNNPFLIQISVTIIAPTPLVAANFIILGKIIRRLGGAYSRLSPRWYTTIFCTFDVISLVVQAVGGATASSATDEVGAENGAHIMLGGIVFQMACITIYVFLAAEFFLRFIHDKPLGGLASSHKGEVPTVLLDKPMQIMIGGLIFNTTCLFIRAVYRTIELSDGWHGRIISTQLYFNVLDGAMVTLAIFTLNFTHPGFLLRDSPTNAGSGSPLSVPDVEKRQTGSVMSAEE
jgi:hypothetical protein